MMSFGLFYFFKLIMKLELFFFKYKIQKMNIKQKLCIFNQLLKQIKKK